MPAQFEGTRRLPPFLRTVLFSVRLLPLALLLSLPGYGADADTPTRAPARHGLSPEASAALKAGLPKYTAPKPAAAEPATTTVDQGSAEELPGGILRLPEYFVTEKKISGISEYDMLTTKGKLDLARKRHPGLGFGPFAGLNGGIGLAMLAEEHAIETRREAADLVELSTIGQATRDKKLQDALREVQLRREK